MNNQDNNNDDDKFREKKRFNQCEPGSQKSGIHRFCFRRLLGKQFAFFVLFLFIMTSAFVSGFFGSKINEYLQQDFGVAKLNSDRVAADSEIHSRFRTCAHGSVNNDLVDMIERVVPGVAGVTARSFLRKKGDNMRECANAGGSGFFARRDGKVYVITNCHVVKEVVSNSGEVRVFAGDEKEGDEGYRAVLLGMSEDDDIAVLRVIGADDKEEIGCLDFEDEKVVKRGLTVVALGHPFREKQVVVTNGVVSCVSDGKWSASCKKPTTILQTTANVNHGSSGGPLINVKTGRVVGLMTGQMLSVTETSGDSVVNEMPAYGVFKAVGIKPLKEQFDEITKASGKNKPGLGVVGEFRGVDGRKVGGYVVPAGFVVKGFTKDSAAKWTGLQVNDKIFEVDGKAIESFKDLSNIISSSSLDKPVKVSFYRPDENKLYYANVYLNFMSPDKLESKALPN